MGGEIDIDFCGEKVRSKEVVLKQQNYERRIKRSESTSFFMICRVKITLSDLKRATFFGFPEIRNVMQFGAFSMD